MIPLVSFLAISSHTLSFHTFAQQTRAGRGCESCAIQTSLLAQSRSLSQGLSDGCRASAAKKEVYCSREGSREAVFFPQEGKKSIVVHPLSAESTTFFHIASLTFAARPNSRWNTST